MIQTATLSPMLPTQARSTTVPNGPTPGDFAGSFAQANDGAPKMPTPNLTIPALSPGTIVRQDAAVTGNTLPTPAATEAVQVVVPEIAILLAEPLAVGERPTSQASVALAPSAIPAKADPAVPDVAAKRASAARPIAVARLAAFAVSSRGGKAKDDAPTTASDDPSDAPLADPPALPGLTALAQPLVEVRPDVLPEAPVAPTPPAEATTTLVPEDTVAPPASAISGMKQVDPGLVGAKPVAAAEAGLTTPITSASRQSLEAELVQVGPGASTTTSVAQILATPRSVLPPATAKATVSTRRTVEVADLGQISPPQVTPVAATPATAVITALAAAAPVANPPLQIVALAAAVPVAPQLPGVIPPPVPTSGQSSTAQPLEPAALASPPAVAGEPAIATPRWVATDATTPVALALAQPAAVQPQPGTVASASQVFGAAIQAATKARDDRDTTDPTAPSVTAGAPVSPPPIKTAEAQQTPLDMRQERWPHAMIERIEILRDAADATDTRIRLVPDALGAIDVSVRKDGDTVHVHFNAEQAATRTLLQDAQPRLVELAEARGLKLGQGALGDGPAGSSQQRTPAAPHMPNRPTTPTAAVIADAHEDTRIA